MKTSKSIAIAVLCLAAAAGVGLDEEYQGMTTVDPVARPCWPPPAPTPKATTACTRPSRPSAATP